MKTEEIIYILLIFALVYLIFNSTLLENFSQNNKIRLALLSNNKVYRFVSFFDLKDDIKKLALEYLQTEYKKEMENNNLVPSDKKTNNSFLAFGIENALINATPENIQNILSKDISKVPVFIIDNDKVEEYTKTIFDINQPTQLDKGLSPDRNKFMYWNKNHQLLFYSESDRYGKEIKGLAKNENNNEFDFEPIKIDNKEILLNKFVEKTIGNFTHYVISIDEGTDFEWKWYSNDLSKIQ